MRHQTLVTLCATAVLALGCDQLTNGSPTAPSGASTGAGVPTTTGASTATPPISSSDMQALYAQFTNGVQVSMGGSTVTLRTNDVPDHPSPYFGVGHPLYEAPHAGMFVNPHRIGEQNITLRVPAIPTVSSPSDTPLGPIGVAVNGVVFFNQYAAGRQPLTFEIESFDRYSGHPAPGDTYHYHIEPRWLTRSSRTRLLGVLLDGFPVYGPLDSDGRTPTDLDVCHGHVSATPEIPDGIYHYHTTDTAPYISGCFRGIPGTVG